jgi:hypothetical protein
LSTSWRLRASLRAPRRVCGRRRQNNKEDRVRRGDGVVGFLVIPFALPLMIFIIFSIIFTPHPAKLTALIAEYMEAFMKLWDVFLSLIGAVILSAICKYISRL